MLDAGYITPKEIQTKTISRMLGGKNIVAIASPGSGKTTAYVFATLMRIKGPEDGNPRAVILVSNNEQALAITDLFKWFGKNTGIRTYCLAGGRIGEECMEALEDGLVDVIIGTPEKINTLFAKSLLNLRALLMLVVDEADSIARTSQLAIVYHLFEGLTKCQRLIFANTLNDKLERLIEQALPVHEFIETELQETAPGIIPMAVYTISNYKAKLNLLELLLRDPALLSKAVLFTNTKASAEALHNSLKKRVGKTVCRLHLNGLDSLQRFKESAENRVIILCNEDQPSFNLLGIPYLIHFELPSSKEIFIKRVTKIIATEANEAISLTLATNQEMETVKKLEQTIGQKMREEKLPSSLSPDGISSTQEDLPPGTNTNSSWNWKIS